MLLLAAMSTPVTIAKATISMEEGLILQWLKAEGDLVVKDEVLFEMETDKALVEVGAPTDGVLLKILVSEGPVKVESVVGWIGKPGEAGSRYKAFRKLRCPRRAQAPAREDRGYSRCPA
jgi:pyruvate/2-oxoglutarate dehydrogenase complex dihydrolipoamide acyltransferase (E2) component